MSLHVKLTKKVHTLMVNILEVRCPRMNVNQMEDLCLKLQVLIGCAGKSGGTIKAVQMHYV